MLDIPSISGIVAAVGVLVGVVFAVLQLRDLVKTRQTDLFMRLYSTFGSKEFLEARRIVWNLEFKDYSDYRKKYGSLDETFQVGSFFEAIGVLLHRKLIDIGLVDDLVSYSITRTWEKTKTLVEGMRKQFNQPRFAEWFEYLYNEIKRREPQLAT